MQTGSKLGMSGAAKNQLLSSLGYKRPLINKLQKRNYQIVYRNPEDKNDGKKPQIGAVLAIDKNRFDQIKNKSKAFEIAGRPRYVAIATATDKITKQPFVFASLHAPGFDLSKKQIAPKDAHVGDQYCKLALQRIQTLAAKSNATTVIGGDFNCYPEKYKKRFDIFSNNRFQTLRTHTATNVNPLKAKKSERTAELDYFFFSSPSHKFSAKIHPLKPINWQENSSDHKPIFSQISFKPSQKASKPSLPPVKKKKHVSTSSSSSAQKKKSCLNRIFSCIARAFRSLCCCFA